MRRLSKTYKLMLLLPVADAALIMACVYSGPIGVWRDTPPWYGVVLGFFIIFGGLILAVVNAACIAILHEERMLLDEWRRYGKIEVVARLEEDGRVAVWQRGGGQPANRLASFDPEDDEAAIEFVERTRSELRHTMTDRKRGVDLVRVINRG